MAETRLAIVDAARALFHEKGYVETTVDEIAERADVAQRTFFRYFPSKQAVLFADFEELFAQLMRDIESRPEDEPPLLSLFVAMRQHTREVEARFETLTWVMETAEKCGGLGVEGAVLRDQKVERLTQVIARRLGVEPVVDPRPGAWASMMFSCFGAAIHAAIRTGSPLHDTFVKLVCDTSESMRELTAETEGRRG